MKDYNLICFGYFPWGNMWKRNQSMIAQIAKFKFINNTIFVNPVRSVRTLPISNILKIFSPSKHRDDILVFSPIRSFPLKTKLPSLKKLENQIFYSTIKRLNQNKPFILFINDPIRVINSLLDKLLKDASYTIFDFSDDFVEYFNDKTDNRRNICLNNLIKYAGSADIVLSVNDHIKRKYNFLCTQINVIRNATNYENFDRASYAPVNFLEKIRANNRPIVGYSGGIRENRLDFSLLEYIFERKKNWNFVFIGDADKAFKERFMKYDNVYLFPPVRYDQLPNCIKYFDVAFVPFKICEHTKGNDLLKFHDYLSMGKPIVSTDVGGAEYFKDVISVVCSPSDFIEEMNKALKEISHEVVIRRKKIAYNNSWQKRSNEIEMLIKHRLSEFLN